MRKIFLKNKIDFNLLIYFSFPVLLQFIKSRSLNDLLTASILFIIIFLITQFIYIWRWSSHPLLTIEANTLSIYRIGAFNINDIQYIELRKEQHWYIFHREAIGIKFASEHSYDLLRKSQEDFFTLIAAPFNTANSTIKIYKELSMKKEEIVALIEKKIVKDKKASIEGSDDKDIS